MRRQPYQSRRDMLFPVVVGVLMVILFTLICCHAHADSIPKERVVNAIIGESEGGGLSAMRCTASAIRNRKTLRGVYGEHSARVRGHKYSAKTFVLAVQAYEESRTTDYVGGATHWGNASDVVKFKKTKWFKSMKFVKECGGNYYYKEVR